MNIMILVRALADKYVGKLVCLLTFILGMTLRAL